MLNYNQWPQQPAMARTEQKYLIDRETLDHLLAMLRDGVAKGASDKEIREQTQEILDPDYRAKVDRALKEASEGKARRFKNAEEMIRDLHSR
jgi:hypothetical protein